MEGDMKDFSKTSEKQNTPIQVAQYFVVFVVAGKCDSISFSNNF